MLSLDKMITPEEKGKKKNKDVAATPLMKRVAAAAPNNKKSFEKTFSKPEQEEIARKRVGGAEPEQDSVRLAKAEKREKYRAIKRRVKEMEIGNQDRIIAFPSLSDDDRWYKLMEFSALYYAYRLAPRMGRKARILQDSDRFLKSQFATSLFNIEDFVAKIKDYEEGIKIDKSKDGVYIFTLPRPITDDDYAALRRTEETRRERLHNVLKPKDMDPAIFNALLMVERQLLPRIKKLERGYYDAVGKTMAENVHRIMMIYGMLTDGLVGKDDAGIAILENVNSLAAGLILLAELRTWPYETAALIGENINTLKKLVLKDFIGKA